MMGFISAMEHNLYFNIVIAHFLSVQVILLQELGKWQFTNVCLSLSESEYNETLRIHFAWFVALLLPVTTLAGHLILICWFQNF